MTNFIDGLNFSLHIQNDLEDCLLAEKVIQMMLAGPKFLRPKRFAGLHPINRRVDPDNIKPIVNLWMGNKTKSSQNKAYKEGLLLLEFCREGDFMINWVKGHDPPFKGPKFNSISGGIPKNYVLKPDSRLIEYLEFIIQLINVTNPIFGIIQNMMTPQWDVPYDLTIRLPDIPWGSIFGNLYIDFWGREKLLNAPFYHIEELPSSHIFATLSDSILNADIPANIRSEIRSHLGEKCFMEGKKSYKHYRDGITPTFK